jgi:hypothetical protein
MDTCSYCAHVNSCGVIRCQHCGAHLPRPNTARPVAGVVAASSSGALRRDPKTPTARPTSARSNLGGTLVGTSVLVMLAGRLLGQTVVSVGWLMALAGWFLFLKDKSTKVKYGGALALSLLMLAVLMPESDRAEPKRAAPAPDTAMHSAETAGRAALETTGRLSSPNSTEPDTTPAHPALPRAREPQLSQVAVSQRMSIGLSYGTVMNYLTNFFVMEEGTTVEGLPRYSGQSKDGLAILEIIGDKSDIAQATLLIALPNDSPDTVITNTALVLRFLKNTFPGWKGADKWVMGRVQELSKSPQGTASIRRGNKVLDVTVLTNMGMVTLTVRNGDTR